MVGTIACNGTVLTMDLESPAFTYGDNLPVAVTIRAQGTCSSPPGHPIVIESEVMPVAIVGPGVRCGVDELGRINNTLYVLHIQLTQVVVAGFGGRCAVGPQNDQDLLLTGPLSPTGHFAGALTEV